MSEKPAQSFTPLVLEQDDVTHKPVLQVHLHFLSKLKPHQQEGERNFVLERNNPQRSNLTMNKLVLNYIETEAVGKA